MGVLSTNLKAIASSLLTDFGETVTFIRETTSEYNVNTGAVDPVTTTTYSGNGYTRFYTINEIDGNIVQQNDIFLLVYTTTEPVVNDTVSVDSVLYRVMNVEKLKAQGENVLYRVQLRV